MSRQITQVLYSLTFHQKSISNILLIESPSLLPKFRFGDTEDGRQGMVGNGYTSRVWKGDGIIRKADISNTVSAFLL